MTSILLATRTVPDGRNMMLVGEDWLADVNDGVVVMPYGKFDNMCREMDRAKNTLDDALHEGDCIEEYCETVADE